MYAGTLTRLPVSTTAHGTLTSSSRFFFVASGSAPCEKRVSGSGTLIVSAAPISESWSMHPFWDTAVTLKSSWGCAIRVSIRFTSGILFRNASGMHLCCSDVVSQREQYGGDRPGLNDLNYGREHERLVQERSCSAILAHVPLPTPACTRVVLERGAQA